MLLFYKKYLYLTKDFPKSLVVVLIGTFLIKFSVFMSLPLLTIYMLTNLKFSPFIVGFILGSSSIVEVIISPISGSYADHFGCKKSIICSIIGVIACYVGYYVANNEWEFLFVSFFMGVFRGIYEPSSLALISSFTKADTRRNIFALRHVLINLGATLGPVIGGVIMGTKFFLCLSIGSILFYLLLVVLYLEDANVLNSEEKEKYIITNSYKLFLADKRLFYTIIAGCIACASATQLVTTFPMHLTYYYEHLVKYYPYLISLSGISIVMFQYYITKISQKISLQTLLLFGSLLYSLGLIFLAYGFGYIVIYALAIVIFTIGEMLLIPTQSSLVDNWAPDSKKAAYFGTSSLRYFGFSIGPILGGILVEYVGTSETLLLFSASMIVSCWLFYKASGFKTPAMAFR